MATVNFLYRSTKEQAPLNLRLLYRLGNKDFVLGAKTKLQVSKHYWSKEHPQKRPKDIEISNKQLEVNTEINNIEKHILGAFNEANPKEVTKDWLVVQMDLYYNPPQQNAGLPTNLIDYIEFYIDYRKHEITPTTVIKYELKHDYLENARDWLIISCYTGQRISDFLRFTKEMIRIEDGKSLLEFTQKKTGKVMTVPLHKKVLEILKKRNGEFPRSISDQRYNDYIKVVCKEAKLNEKIQGGLQMKTDNGVRKVSGKYHKWELVTSHIGRRSFATNFYGKIPTTYLIYITGHSSEAMFLNYIGKSNKDLAMEISNYF